MRTRAASTIAIAALHLLLALPTICTAAASTARFNISSTAGASTSGRVGGRRRLLSGGTEFTPSGT
jgi:hypothetical protein